MNASAQPIRRIPDAFLDDLRARTPLVELVRRNARLEKSGRDFVCCCPFHSEKTPSFHIYADNHFHCFGCGIHGDVISYVRHRDKTGFTDAVARLADEAGMDMPGEEQQSTEQKPRKPINGSEHKQANGKDPDDEWISTFPTPPGVGEPVDLLNKLGHDALHAYPDATGRPGAYVARFDARGEKDKWFQPVSYGSMNGVAGWYRKAITDKRPLYRLDRLLARPDAPVLICEGEKSADAADLMYPDYVCTTWQGGAEAVGKTDWSPLLNRASIIWPDNDPPGHKAAAEISKRLWRARIMRVDDLPSGHDAADVHPDDPEAWLKERVQPDIAETIGEKLDSHSWAKLEIEKECRFLGDLVTPSSRTFLIGTTGLGKTLLAYEIGGAMASGQGFLDWKCDRASRWLIIDGEMPTSLIKKRIAGVLGRHKIPPGGIFIYSLGRSEELAKQFAGLGELQPLNTPAGQAWVINVAKLLKVDGIIFDNVMSLIPGEHKEEQPWRDTLPLVMELTNSGLSQIWLDHTGWNADRQYGSSTKAWRFDSVGVMKALPEAELTQNEVGFTLSFESPGKCRRRSPDNWSDFETRTIRFSGGRWTADVGGRPAKPLTKDGDGWYRDLLNMFATDGLAEKRTVFVGGGKTLPGGVLTLTRKQVRDGYRSCGRIGSEGANEPLTQAERVLLNKRLSELKDRGKIGIASGLVWLV